MAKIDTYLKRFATDINVSNRSRYYKLGTNLVIRVSDHFAVNSTGTYGFILTRDEDSLIFYRRTTGQCSVLTYREAQEMIRSLTRLPELNIGLEDNRNNAEGIVIGSDVITIRKSELTKGQVNQIRTYQQQNARKKKSNAQQD